MNDPESAIYAKKNNDNEYFYNNSNGITANLSKNELDEKENKISRFVNDYCRASPNISLKQKQTIFMGWRNTKFHFEVDIDMQNLNYNTDTVRDFIKSFI